MPALSMVAAKPMPMKVRDLVGLRMAVTMPTTSPSMVTSGPPELPGLAAASNCMSPESVRLPSGDSKPRLSPDTTPADTEGPMPNGKPTATTSSPGRSLAVEPMVAGGRSSGMFFALMTARSFSGCAATNTASDSMPSEKVSMMRFMP